MASRGSMRLFLVRHGEVAANRRLAFVGRGDDSLTREGRSQAAALGEMFKHLAVDRVLSSPLERSLETGAPIAEATGLSLDVDPRLIEQSFGQWEGLTRQQIGARGARDRQRLRAWRKDPSTPPPGGESLRSVQRRMVELVVELAASDPAAVVMVSHVSPIKALLCETLGLSLGRVKNLFLDPASISVVDWSSSPVLRIFNAHPHQNWQWARWEIGF